MAAFLGKRYIGIVGTGSGIGQGGIYISTGSGAAPYTPLVDSLVASPQFAWSVWQMSASQPLCVRLRRDSDNAELDFGFTAIGLVDTVAINTWLGGANAFVVTFYGVTRTATESVAGDQARFYTSGGNDNLPYAEQNTNVVLQNYPLSSSIPSSAPLHIITMSHHPAVGQFSSVFSTSAGAVRYWYAYADDNIGVSSLRLRPSSSYVYSQTPGALLGDCLAELTRNASNLLVTRINNVQTSSATVTDSVATLSLFTTGTTQGEMKISTALFFNSQLSTGDRDTVIAFYDTQFNKNISYEVETLSFLSAIYSKGSTITYTEAQVYNTLFLDLKGQGTTGSSDILSKTDTLQVYIAPTEISAKIDLKNLQDVDFNNTYTFTPKLGFAGDGSTGFINTKFNPTTVAGNYQLNSSFILVAANSAVNGHYVGGARRTSNDQSYVRLAVSAAALDNPMNSTGGNLFFATHSGEYYAAVDRPNASSTIAYLNGVQGGSNTQASNTLLDATMVVPGFNSFPASPTALNPIALNNRTYRFFAAGGSLNSAEHLQLYNSLEKFKISI